MYTILKIDEVWETKKKREKNTIYEVTHTHKKIKKIGRGVEFIILYFGDVWSG
jgi:hypothetical protein